MNVTAKHKTWWREFTVKLNNMPKDLEILVGAHGQMSVAERGASRAYFEKHGHVDNVPRISELPEWHGDGVEDNSSSL